MYSPAELDLAYYRQETDGVSIFTSIGGFSGSTKTEIAAGILAACGNGLVFLASDSEVFGNKGVNILMRHINQGSSVYIHFKLKSYGDLLEHMYKVLLAKGPHSFKASLFVHTLRQTFLLSVLQPPWTKSWICLNPRALFLTPEAYFYPSRPICIPFDCFLKFAIHAINITWIECFKKQ